MINTFKIFSFFSVILFTAELAGQNNLPYFYLFGYSTYHQRHIVKLSSRLIQEWKVNGDILRLYYYDENHPQHGKFEREVEQPITDFYFLEYSLNFPGTEKISLIDNGFNFDLEAGDGIHGAY